MHQIVKLKKPMILFSISASTIETMMMIWQISHQLAPSGELEWHVEIGSIQGVINHHHREQTMQTSSRVNHHRRLFDIAIIDRLHRGALVTVFSKTHVRRFGLIWSDGEIFRCF